MAHGSCGKSSSEAYDHWNHSDEVVTLDEEGRNRGMETIKWHPYPKEKPTEEGTYLVTMKYEDKEEAYVTTSVFIWAYDCFCGGRFVTAWAELPKPYEEGAEE